MSKIRIGICGYGNLGRAAEEELKKNPDMELVAVFSRRDNLKIASNVPAVNIAKAEGWKDKIDVMLMCGGSAKDLPIQSPQMANIFNIVDSFDTHADIPTHLQNVDKSAKEGGKLALISMGWDPGLFSLMRLYFSTIIPNGSTYTFWGDGVSQGHSDAIRTIKGVKKAIQYTLPVPSAIEKVRRGEGENLTTRDKHTRLCYVVVEEGADKTDIERQIKEMPKYFSDYDTTVNFISEEEFVKNHSKLPHGGNVIHNGKTGIDNKQMMELTLKLDSNPEFTSSILIAFARAAYRLFQYGKTGARTIFDVPPALISPMNREDLIKKLV